jgi:ribonuclease HI
MQGSLDTMLATHFPGSTPGPCPPIHAISPPPENFHVLDFITESKIREAFASFGPYKSPGPDGLYPVVLQNLPAPYITAIRDIYRVIISTGYTPSPLRRSRVVFIPKPGKNKSECKGWRPISLSSFVLKGLERIILWYILYFNEGSLPHQHAYQRGKGCDTALLEFREALDVKKGKPLLAVSLDASGAFDNVPFHAIMDGMNQWDIPKPIVNWYNLLLRTRTIETESQGILRKCWPQRGTPQGGILSPLAWNLALNQLLSHRLPVGCSIIAYADDLLLIVRGPQHSLEERASAALDLVHNWGLRNNIVFNPLKTQLTNFSRNRKRVADITLAGSVIEPHTDLKFLGITFDKKLSFKQHINLAIAKAKRLFHQVRRITSTEWGLSPSKLSWIYHAILVPKISYGSFIWIDKMSQQTSKLLEKCQRGFLMAITGAKFSAPTKGIQAILGIPPLDLQIQEVAANALIRLRATGRVPFSPAREIAAHIIHPQCPIDQTFAREWPLFEIDPQDTPPPPAEGTLMIYTDGSKMGDLSGFGWAACHLDSVLHEHWESIGEATVFQSEVLAIHSAAKWLKYMPKDFNKALILSDSQAALGALKNSSTSSTLILECKQALNALLPNWEIHLAWTRGHVDTTGNEFADYLAKQGTLGRPVGPHPYIPVALPPLKASTRNRTLELWRHNWAHEPRCRQTKMLQHLPAALEQKLFLLSLPKRLLKKLVDCTTGHCLLQRHSHIIDRTVSPTCRLCKLEDETPEHFLVNCPGTMTMRLALAKDTWIYLTQDKTNFLHLQWLSACERKLPAFFCLKMVRGKGREKLVYVVERATPRLRFLNKKKVKEEEEGEEEKKKEEKKKRTRRIRRRKRGRRRRWALLGMGSVFFSLCRRRRRRRRRKVLVGNYCLKAKKKKDKEGA